MLDPAAHSLRPPPIAAADIVSGERLQAIADVAVMTEPKRRFHTSCPQMPFAEFAPDLAPDPAAMAVLRGARVIFVYAEMVGAFFARIVPHLDQPFVLITHNADENIDARYRALADHPRLIHWFAQNVAIAHPKLTALPIGIANAQWPHGDAAAVARVAAQARPQGRGLYVNFLVSTNPAVRGPLHAALADKPFSIMGRRAARLAKPVNAVLRGLRLPYVYRGHGLPFAGYLADMAKWQFCVSPPGNGLDCHRTWEALCVGVVPVMSTRPVGLLDGLPVIVLDDLASVTMEGLEAARAAFAPPFAWEKLSVAAWRQRIRAMALG